MTQGTVKWFSGDKGYGFISQDAGGADVFVHHSSIEADGYRELGENQRVEFEITQGSKGPHAEHVRLIQAVVDVWAYFRGGLHDGGGGEVPGHGVEARYPPLADVSAHGARYERARPLKVVQFQGEQVVVYDYDATIDARG